MNIEYPVPAIGIPSRFELERDIDLMRYPDLSAHVGRSTTVQEVIFGWLTNERNILVIEGTDDLDNSPAVYIVFREKKNELGSILIPTTVVRSNYPLIRPCIHPWERDPAGDKEDGEWNEIIQDFIISQPDSMNHIWSYALSGEGEAMISYLDDPFYDDACEGEEPIPPEQRSIVSIDLFYSDRITGKGFCEFRYTKQERQAM